MKKILILDDETIIRQSFTDYFEDNLWQTVQADSAEQALILLEQQQVDAAIVDIRLPGIDGNDFIRKVAPQQPSMVYVICTGSPEYQVPFDLQAMPTVCSRLFKKPVTNLQELEFELLNLMDNNQN